MNMRNPIGAHLRGTGFSLVELMVALAIGSVLIIGAVFVYSQSRTTYALNETTARLQEEARYALSIIEPDLQLAGYYGFTNNPDDVRLWVGGVNTPTAQLRQVDAAAAGLTGAADDCGRNFTTDLMMTLQGSNDAFLLGPGFAAPGPGSGCADMVPQVGSDTLTLRRVSTTPAALQAARLQAYVNRLQSSSERLFVNGVAPGPITASMTEIRNLIVRTYYVARDSDGRPGYPSLRVISLGNGEAFTDLELIPGVEDLQVQFGVDTGDYDNDGAIDLDADGNGVPEANGIATRYVNPNSNILQPPPVGNSVQVVSVRLWLRLRAEQPEVGFTDARNYVYGTTNYTPAGAAAAFRRVLVTRTINLRNARTL